MKKLFLSLSLICLMSCDDEPITFFSLGEFRVLTLQADTPEIDGTASTPTIVNITPYISDVDAEGRNVTLTILACPDPGIELGVEPSCDANSPSTQSITYPTVDTTTLGTRFTGAMPSFAVSIPPNLLTDQTPQIKFNGLNYLVTVEFKAGNESASVYKRIVISERATKNNNPKINHVLLNGITSGSLADQDQLSISVAPGFNPETYDTLSGNGQQISQDEQYTVSWFSYKGTTKITRTFLDEKTEFELNKGETNPFVVAILRDDRGGIDFKLHE